MLASACSVVTQPQPLLLAPSASAHPVPYDGPRVVAADFFVLARAGRAVTTPPPFRDGDCVSCPRGTEWMRNLGQWITPGQPHGLVLPDRVVTGWWQTRAMPGSRFALVHRLAPGETSLITGNHYISSVFTGDWLRSIAWQAARTRTVSVHLELPSGIVTLHSRLVGNVFFHPAPAPVPAVADAFRTAGWQVDRRGPEALHIHPPLTPQT